MKKLLIGFLTLYLALLSSSKVSAATIYQNDFSTEDLSGWTTSSSTPCKINGQNAYWEVRNGKVGIEINGSSCVTEIVPPNPEVQNLEEFVFEFDMDFASSIFMDRNFLIRYQDRNNWYDYHFYGNKIWFQKYINGVETQLANGYQLYDFQPNTTYRMKNVVRKDGKIELYINNELIISVQDEGQKLLNGSIGFQASVGGTSASAVWFDNVVVKTIDEFVPTPTPTPTPPIIPPYYSQRDPLWGGDEYDHASKYTWATTPTMARYGCATTTMAMIMNAHGLTQMPDGTPLTPKSLNEWLKEQKNGYISEALINWREVTRLTYEIAQKYPDKPKLEYASIATTELSRVREEIDARMPVILRVPGHFVTAYAYENDTISIHDPYWSERTTLAVAPYNNSFESMRTFRPSQTDLSYLSFAHDKNVEIQLMSSEGYGINPSEIYTEGGIAPQEGSGTQPETTITDYAQPYSDGYPVFITREEPGEFVVNLYAYNEIASSSAIKLIGYGGMENKFLVNYHKEMDAHSILEVTRLSPTPTPTPTPTATPDPTPTPTPQPKLATFVDLYIAILKLYKAGEIKRFSALVRLETPTVLGHYARTTPLKRHFALLVEHQLTQLKAKDITPAAKAQLQSMIDQIQSRYAKK